MKNLLILFLTLFLCVGLFVAIESQPEMFDKPAEVRFYETKLEYGATILYMMSKNVPNYKRQLYVDSIIESTLKWSNEFDVDILWAFALIGRESCFNPTAKGKNGDCGLTQITMSAVREYERYFNEKIDKKEMFDINTNIKIGIWYLSRKLHENKDDYRVALAKYNAGRFWNTHGLKYYRLVKEVRTDILTIKYDLNMTLK